MDFGNEDWKIFSNGMSYHMFDGRVMPYYYCDEWYHWFNGVINDDDDDDCCVGGLTMWTPFPNNVIMVIISLVARFWNNMWN